MPKGKGTYGSKVGRPPKKKKTKKTKKWGHHPQKPKEELCNNG